MASKRIESNLVEMKDYQDDFFIIPDPNDKFHFKCLMKGPKDSHYEGITIRIYIRFPHDYPFKPPSFIYSPALFHPNITRTLPIGILNERILEGGLLEFPLLGRDWCPAYGLRAVLIHITTLLYEPYYCQDENTDDKGKDEADAAYFESQIEKKQKPANEYARELWDDKEAMRLLIIESLHLDDPHYLELLMKIDETKQEHFYPFQSNKPIHKNIDEMIPEEIDQLFKLQEIFENK